MKIDCAAELHGEYNIKVIENNNTIQESGWSKNTILSGGLVYLYNNPITALTQYLDLGKSNLFPGKSGYMLNEIVSIPDYAAFRNIPQRNTQAYNETSTTRVFYSYFTSNPSPAKQVFNEFAIKPSPLSGAFARNVFTTPVTVLQDQYIIFEYRVRVQYNNTFTQNLRVFTNNNQTFTIPCTGFTYNIPYDELYRPDNELFLVTNKENIPIFGSMWPRPAKFAVLSRDYSRFLPTEIGYSIDNITKTFTVSTSYLNVSARPLGLHNNINTIILSRNTSKTFPQSLPNDKFFGVKFEFPLCLYNFITNSFDLSGESSYNTSVMSRNNRMDLAFNYSWREA